MRTRPFLCLIRKFRYSVRRTSLSPCNFNAPFVIIGEMISQIAASAISVYTITEPTPRGSAKIAETRLKLKIPYMPQFNAPSKTRIYAIKFAMIIV